MGLKGCFFFIFLVFLPGTSWAEITNIILTNNRFSRETGQTDLINFSQITIYGATSGPDSSADCTGKSTTNTCDNCKGNVPCTKNRIHNDLELEISFQTTVRGKIKVYGGPISRSNSLADYKIMNVESAAANVDFGIAGSQNAVTFKVKWSELCQKIGGNIEAATALQKADCSDISSEGLQGELYFGMDGVQTANGTGSGALEIPATSEDDVNTTRRIIIDIRKIETGEVDFCTSGAATSVGGACNFDLFPGDGKAFIDNVRTSESGFSSTTYSALRFYFSQDPTVDTSSALADIPLPINSGSSNGIVPIETNEIGGVENLSTYYFRMASIDIASNVGYLTPAYGGLDTGNVNENGSPTLVNDLCYDTSIQGMKNCHEVTPDAVIGLLEKEFDCFIATAAFGSPMEAHVATFRRFRNQILHASPWGRRLIRFYYEWSPPLARFIEDRPALKSGVRTLLLPLWFFAKWALQAPVSLCLGLLILMIGILGRRSFFKVFQSESL